MSSSRKDATRNHAALLLAARDAVAAHGVDVGFNLIAHKAGVGRATLYRHFPTREALLQALLQDALDQVEAVAEDYQEDDGLFAILSYCANNAARNAPLTSWWRASDAHPFIAKARSRFRKIATPALRRAIDAGHCRNDLNIDDVLALVTMTAAAPQQRRDGKAATISPERLVSLLLDGIKIR